MSDCVRRHVSCAISLAIAAAAVAGFAVPARAAEQDHPLVSRYPGSKLEKLTAKDFEDYQLVVGIDTGQMAFTGKPLKGRVTRVVYRNPADRSTLEILQNYRQALTAEGAEILFECDLDACGKAYARSAWNRFNGLFAASDGDPRYLAARIAKDESEAFVAVMVGKARTQIDVVELKAMDTGLVKVDPNALAKALTESGSARVYGILFDFDKSDIRPESKPALDAIAELLQSNPALSVFVVGHTDSKGALDLNMTLSKARARAVVAALTTDYGIAAERLDPHGVGPLAPVATNATEDGRTLNRRVELVAR